MSEDQREQWDRVGSISIVAKDVQLVVWGGHGVATMRSKIYISIYILFFCGVLSSCQHAEAICALFRKGLLSSWCRTRMCWILGFRLLFGRLLPAAGHMHWTEGRFQGDTFHAINVYTWNRILEMRVYVFFWGLIMQVEFTVMLDMFLQVVWWPQNDLYSRNR